MRVSSTVENALWWTLSINSREPSDNNGAAGCSPDRLFSLRVLFQLLTTIDGADGANAMVATFTDDTYDSEYGPGADASAEAPRSAFPITGVCDIDISIVELIP